MTKIKRDPWQSLPSIPKQEVAPARKKEEDESESGVPGFPRRHATIEVKDYGGISVTDTQNTSAIPGRLLKFMIAEREKIEDVLTNYGILVVQLADVEGLETPFYLQADDGWTIAVPSVKDRTQGMIQLIQALAALDKPLLEKYKLRVYKT